MSSSPPPPTSPKAVLRFLRKSLDAPNGKAALDGPTEKNTRENRQLGGGGFRARFLRPRLKRSQTLPVELEAELPADLVVSEDRSARDVGLPTGTRFVESDTISRHTSASRRTPSIPRSFATGDQQLVSAESIDDVVAFAVAAAPEEPAPTTVQRSLARKIQNLLSAVPPFYPTVESDASRSADPGSGSGSGTPPGGAVDSSSLFKLLSSASVMNGTWGILDRLMSSSESAGISHGKDDNAPSDASFMIYGPLIIDAESTVELARSAVVSMNVEVTEEIHHPAHAQKSWWPFGGHHRSAPAPPLQDSFERRRSVVVQDVTVWYPSLTKMSIKCTWWGFRLYLPPPVMLVLDKKELETAQRAAMITTALTWIVNNVPVSSLPVPLIPVVGVLKALVPIIGYIAGFIAWSWGQIKSFDKGQGVVLSATWLLPIALIPGAWDAPPPPPPPPADPPAEPEPAPTPAPAEPAPAPAPAEPAPTPAPAEPAPAPTEPMPTDPTPTPAPSCPSDPPSTTPAEPTPAQPVADKAKKGWFGK